MTTEIANRQTQNPIQRYGQSLAPPDRSKHRAWIGVRVEALLDGYWQNRPHEAVKEEIIADWMDGLETFTPNEIRAACRAWLSDNPRRKPNLGDIRAIVLAARRKAVPPKPPEPKREPVTAEAAQEILVKAGFAPNRIGGGHE